MKKIDFSKYNHFHIIAISSHDDEFRLIWEINKNCNLHIIKEDDISLNTNGITQNFSFSTFYDKDNLIEYSLIGNVSESGFLLPQFKNIDYFLKLNGEASNEKIEKINSILNSCDSVITSFSLDKTKIKSIDRIVSL